MNLTHEQIEAAINCKTIEEFEEFIKQEGFKLSQDEIAECFDSICPHELSEEDLKAVSGGSTRIGGTTYSDESPYYAIVGIGHSCSLYRRNNDIKGLNNTCFTCTGNHKGTPGLFRLYCGNRTRDNDPVRGK